MIRFLTILCCSTLLALVPGPARADTVALTFDDLPVFGRYATAEEAAAITDRLLAGFVRHHWRITGFVNESQLAAPDHDARVALLDHWLAAGMDLGNHTYSHLSLNRTPVDAYIADTALGQTVTAGLLAARGRHERWFRYPYLETGLTPAVRQQFNAWLAENRYRVAPVTMENSDWQFAEPYDDALLHGDAVRARRIQRAYLAFTTRVTAWYRRAGRSLFGREPAFVYLLHASRLNAASIDDLAAILTRAHLRVVPLDRAMRDPAYRTADTYVGPDGIEWLERWSQTLHRTLPFDSIPTVPDWIQTDDARLEALSDPQPVKPPTP